MALIKNSESKWNFVPSQRQYHFVFLKRELHDLKEKNVIFFKKKKKSCHFRYFFKEKPIITPQNVYSNPIFQAVKSTLARKSGQYENFKTIFLCGNRSFAKIFGGKTSTGQKCTKIGFYGAQKNHKNERPFLHKFREIIFCRFKFCLKFK